MSTTYSDPYSNPSNAYQSAVAEETHPAVVGYCFWLLGFVGAHRFYFGKPITGAIWALTGGLFLIGWIVDLFLIPAMAAQASRRYPPMHVDYSLAWALNLFLGVFGVHRFYMGKFPSGLLYLLTGGLFTVGWIYDILTLNEQIAELDRPVGSFGPART